MIGVEPTLASDAMQSLKSGKIEPQMPPISIADGLRTNLGTKVIRDQELILFKLYKRTLIKS